MKTTKYLAIVMSALSAGAAFAAQVAVDGKVPAGNIIVEAIDGDTVKLRQDLRDSNNWFYWAFRVTGAEGKTLRFVFTDPYAGGPVSCRGPVVTKDGGRTWSYPCDGKSTANTFVYAFAADEKEVWFYQTFQYYPWQWDAFLARHEADRGKVFETGVLCRSRKERDVPKAVFGRIDGQARHRVWLSSRTHCGEAPATYVLEGWLERVFGKDALGAWLRENVEFMVVPFVDYDGVVDGDQGKGRKPHDHNRDYTEFLYPESRAIAAWIMERANGRIDVAFDHHSPWVRNVYNEKVYQTYHADEWNNRAKRLWGRFVMVHQDGALDYSTADDFPWGFGWNGPKNTANSKPGAKPLKGLGGWIAENARGLLINSTYEIPFANAKGRVVTPEACRAFGQASAAALKDFLEGMSPAAARRDRLDGPDEPPLATPDQWDDEWGKPVTLDCPMSVDFASQAFKMFIRSEFKDDGATVYFNAATGTVARLDFLPVAEEVTHATGRVAVSSIHVTCRDLPRELDEIVEACNEFRRLPNRALVLEAVKIGANRYRIFLSHNVLCELETPSPVVSVGFAGRGAQAHAWTPSAPSDPDPQVYKLPVITGGFALEGVRESRPSHGVYAAQPDACLFSVPCRNWIRAKAKCRIDPTAPLSAVPVIAARLALFRAPGVSVAACERTVDLRTAKTAVVKKGDDCEITFDFNPDEVADLVSAARREHASLSLAFMGPLSGGETFSNLIVYAGSLEASESNL